MHVRAHENGHFLAHELQITNHYPPIIKFHGSLNGSNRLTVFQEELHLRHLLIVVSGRRQLPFDALDERLLALEVGALHELANGLSEGARDDHFFGNRKAVSAAANEF